MTVKSAEDALGTLRSRSNFFHLIITDVHMPVMDGFELQNQVREEFNLPVVCESLQEKRYLATNFLHGKNNLPQNIFISNKNENLSQYQLNVVVLETKM